jgi:hypothetical protein
VIVTESCFEQAAGPHTPATHTLPAPHDAPSDALARVSVQTDVPVLQLVAPTWHALVGVHASPVVHEMHAPPLHTRFVPHDVPLDAFAPVSLHTAAPVAQLIAPVWQAFVDGVQVIPAVQAWQLPFAQ